MIPRLSLSAIVVSLALASSCVSGTVYQRAVELLEHPSAVEIADSMVDQNWKLRCLGARACGATGGEDCLPRLQKLVLDDPEESVKACALEGLADRCEGGGRATLGNLSWEPSAAPSRVFLASFADAVNKCPSADASLMISTSREIPFLEGLIQLPDPRGRTRAVLGDARGRATRLALQAADVAAKEEKQREADEATRAYYLEKATTALARRDVAEAASNLADAELFGADASLLHGQVERVKRELAAEHLARGWEFVRKDKPPRRSRNFGRQTA